MPGIASYFKPANGAVPAAAAKRKGTLSSAARAAILEAKEESPAKRARLSTVAGSCGSAHNAIDDFQLTI